MANGKSSATTLLAFACVTTLFFAWGFITSLNDPVVTAVKGIFCLTDFRAQLAAFAFFIAYGVASFPAAVLLSRAKSIPTILIALVMMIAGCLLMLAAANLVIYELVLVGLFVLAAGITVLQVAANPLAAVLGNPKYSHFRLTFSQTFNSLGTFIGPYLGAVLFLKGIETKECATTAVARTASLAGIDYAYFWICGLLAALALFFVLVRKVVTQAAPPSSHGAASRGVWEMIADAFSSRWTLLGGGAIFLYVGAEVSIGTQMAFFLHSDAVWGLTDAPLSLPLIGPIMSKGADGIVGISAQEAGLAVALYWGGAMVGRAIGSAPARGGAGELAARRLHRDRDLDVPLCVRGGRRRCRRGRAVHRAVQLDHVPGDLHPDARTLERQRGGDFGVPLHLDRRRRSDPAAGRARLGRDAQLRHRLHRPGDLLCPALPVRDRGGQGAHRPGRG